MVQILLSWCWIGLSAFLCGFTFLHLIEKISGYKCKSFDTIIISGLCVLTVYAQTFSLFSKVGVLASAALLILDIILFCLQKKAITAQISKWFQTIKPDYRLITLLLFTALLLIISATFVQHYDSYLYHAQSIRWIEEYGIVPGLGNLHNRLAYNSSLFSLQALFSLHFLFGQSLHSINGFFCVIFVFYAVSSVKIFKEKKFFISDFFRVLILAYLFDAQNRYLISSPGSDIAALGLTLYILTKWISQWEEKEKEPAPYAILCILGVYAISVKLSVAMVILLTLFPAVCLIKQKKWKEIALYLVLGLIIIAPFLVRNVIISGYLLYPYPELDLFQFDWKMPEYTLLFDRNEIKAWGMGLNDVYKFDTPVYEWVPVWIEHFGILQKILFVLNAILLLPALIYAILYSRSKKDWNFFILTITIISCLTLWFIGSPLPRYGSILLTLLPTLIFGMIITRIPNSKILIVSAGTVITIFTLYFAINTVYYVSTQEFNELKSPDYMHLDANETSLDTIILYYPVSGDQMGYHHFPSTPYIERLPLIELRGSDLKDGFKMKDEYKELLVTPYGQLHETNLFE